ncbi:MAG: bifunctional precorrin-2 dehydrogenase/sirohydrochlorin ferrochelatase [Rhizomicrobium sp.]
MSIDFPVSLRLRGVRVVVIGGGYGTGRRVTDLLDAGALVTLIAADAPEGIEALIGRDDFIWQRRSYQSGDLAGVSLVVSCPADKTANRDVWQEAQLRGLLMNAIDDPAHGNFTFPAIHRQGDVTVAVSTAGKSPCLAVALRDRIAAEIGPEYGVFLDLLGDMRAGVVARVASFARRLPIWRRLIASDALAAVKTGNVLSARQILQAELQDALAGDDAANATSDQPVCGEIFKQRGNA